MLNVAAEIWGLGSASKLNELGLSPGMLVMELTCN